VCRGSGADIHIIEKEEGVDEGEQVHGDGGGGGLRVVAMIGEGTKLGGEGHDVTHDRDVVWKDINNPFIGLIGAGGGVGGEQGDGVGNVLGDFNFNDC